MRENGTFAVAMLALTVCSLALIAMGCAEKKTVVVREGHPLYSPPERQGPPPWAQAHGYRAKYRYYYFPASYVYYDTARRLYFYLAGDIWQVGASVPVGSSVDAANYVVLDMDTDKPYQFHSEVVKHYPPGQVKKKYEGEGKGKEKDKNRGE